MAKLAALYARVLALPPLARGGGDVDDLPTMPLLLKRADKGLGAQVGARDLDVYNTLEDTVVEVQDRYAVRAARVGSVVDKHVHAAKLLYGLIDHVLDVLLVGHVRDQRQRLDAVRLDLVGDAVNVAPVDGLLIVRERGRVSARPGHHHVRAQLREAKPLLHVLCLGACQRR